jgi:hypothetical protein
MEVSDSVNTLAYYDTAQNISVNFFVVLGCIHNNSFSSQVKNEPNKLECYITLGWKGFPVTKTPAYWAQM